MGAQVATQALVTAAEADHAASASDRTLTRTEGQREPSGRHTAWMRCVIRSESPEKLATAQLIKGQLAGIGVTLWIRQTEWSQLVSDIDSGNWGSADCGA